MTSSSPVPAPRASCGCPEDEGLVRHQKGTCTDPVVAALGWYFDPVAGDAAIETAPPPAPAPAETCEATLQLHHEHDRFQKFLTCDLTEYGHAGLNHHDPVFGVWWSPCNLDGQFTQHPHRHGVQS